LEKRPIEFTFVDVFFAVQSATFMMLVQVIPIVTVKI
jgi:hypothetical protein